MPVEPANVDVGGDDEIFVGEASSEDDVRILEGADENRVPETDLFLSVKFIQSFFRAPVHAKAVHFVLGVVVFVRGQEFFGSTL